MYSLINIQAHLVARLPNFCADLRQRLTDSQTTQAHLAQALVADNLGPSFSPSDT